MSEYKRLTMRDEHGNIQLMPYVQLYPSNLILALMKQLAQYEDIGSPEEFKQLKDMDKIRKEALLDAPEIAFKNISELAKAKAEGRVLPEMFSCHLNDDGTLVVFHPQNNKVRPTWYKVGGGQDG